MAKDFEYEILEQLGEFSNNGKGMVKEVNVISWNGADGKVDIRNWREDHSRMGKGISYTHAEARKLSDLLNDIDLGSRSDDESNEDEEI